MFILQEKCLLFGIHRGHFWSWVCVWRWRTKTMEVERSEGWIGGEENRLLETTTCWKWENWRVKLGKHRYFDSENEKWWRWFPKKTDAECKIRDDYKHSRGKQMRKGHEIKGLPIERKEKSIMCQQEKIDILGKSINTGRNSIYISNFAMFICWVVLGAERPRRSIFAKINKIGDKITWKFKLFNWLKWSDSYKLTVGREGENSQ